MSRTRRVAAVLVTLAVVAGGGVGLALMRGGYGVGAAREPITYRVRLDGFRLQDLTGARRDLAEWAGRPLLLNFWASWCAPCKEELPALARLHAQHPLIPFIGVAIDEAPAVRAFLQAHDVAYTILLGEHDAVQLAAAVGNPNVALPYTVILDGSGTLVYRQFGVFDDPAELGSVLAGLHPAAALRP